MAYIYLITNKINGKLYVGKTENTIDERWKEHKQDYKKERCEKRPLYDAMLKYGIENFEIKELEYLKEGGKLLSERETYWIETLNTYGRNGYNATKGGDGKTLYDHNKILELYKSIGTMKGVSKELGCGVDLVRDILNDNNIDVEKRKKMQQSKKVELYSLDGKLLNVFDSCRAAGKYLKTIINTSSTFEELGRSIGRCARGDRKTAHKYIWKFKE